MFVCTRAHLPRLFLPDTGLTRVLRTKWVVDTDQDRNRLARHLGVHIPHIHVCNPPRHIKPTPIAWVRDWACRELADNGDWMVWADDNVRRVSCVTGPFYDKERLNFDGTYMGKRLTSNDWRAVYGAAAHTFRVIMLLEQLIEKCEEMGTIYGGFAPEPNYFYRPKHWRWPTGYVKTKLAVYKNDGSPWYAFPGCMLEDYCKSADVVARYGGVVINNFARPENALWEEGGIGSESTRRPYLLQNIASMVEMWPGLLKQDEKIPSNVRFALRTPAQVERWRNSRAEAKTEKGVV